MSKELIVVLHESKAGKAEDASIFGPFPSREAADAFIEWAKDPPYPTIDRIPCDGRDMVKIVQPIRVMSAFSFDYDEEQGR